METIDVAVIGGGVVGLAVASELAGDHPDVFVLEKNFAVGLETSARNSEVIHAGMYYPPGSLKARLCVQGNPLLVEFCRAQGVPYRPIGKLIVAVSPGQEEGLERLFRRGKENGVPDLSLLMQSKVRELEPHIRTQGALWSPSTGILSADGLVQCLLRLLRFRGGDAVIDSKVVSIDPARGGYRIVTRNSKGEESSFLSRRVVNAAGLEAEKVAFLIGCAGPGDRLVYVKGRYFRVHNDKGRFVTRLIYPLPDPSGKGLGIHTVTDVGGGFRLGPDARDVEMFDYSVDESAKADFFNSVAPFLPFIDMNDLGPDTAGIRPKLQGGEGGFRDFIIREESGRGFPGFVNLIGIDSPGLTCCLSIARHVRDILRSEGS